MSNTDFICVSFLWLCIRFGCLYGDLSVLCVGFFYRVLLSRCLRGLSVVVLLFFTGLWFVGCLRCAGVRLKCDGFSGGPLQNNGNCLAVHYKIMDSTYILLPVI